MNRFAVLRRAAALLLAGCAPAALALDPGGAFRDYAIDRWTVDDGLPQLSVHSITQDRDGFLWVGTQNGIARFDGQRFDVYNRQTTGGVDTGDAYHALGDSRGRLWFGTLHGALLHENGRFVPLPMPARATSIHGVVETAAGDILFATDAGVLRHADGALVPAGLVDAPSHGLLREGDALWVGLVGAVTRIGPAGRATFALPATAADVPVTRLAVVRGSVWLGTKLGLYRLRGETVEPVAWERVIGDAAARAFTFGAIEALFVDRDGILWIGTASDLYRLLPDGALERITEADFVRNAFVVSLFEDREGDLWIGSRTESLFRLWNGWTRLIGKRQGLVDPLIWSVVRDPAGDIVFGSNSNVMRLGADGLHELVPGRALPNPAAYELSYDARGRLWIGTRSGLAIYADGAVRTPAAFQRLANHQVNVILPLDDGTVWLGTHDGLYRYDAAGNLRRLGPEVAGPATRVRAIHRLGPDELLLGTEGGVRRLRGDAFDVPAWAQPFEGVFVTSITELRPGLLGLTTRDAGIGLVAGGRLLRVDTAQGLPTSNGWTMQIVDGQLYVASIDGVWRMPLAQLPDPRRTTRARVTTEMVLGRHSGSQHMHCCNGGARSRSLVDGDTIWLPAIHGAVALETRAIVPPPLPPVAMVRGLRHGTDWHAAGAPIAIRSGRRDVEIQFTAISFRDPKNLTFRYMLEGYDSTWQEAGRRRSAFYTNLPPGPFRFRVQARLSDTVVSERDGELALELVPRWHERADLRVALPLAALALAIGLQLTLRQRYRRRGLALQALVEERTRELRRANESLQHRNAELEALNHRLESAQSQLLQSEKMASVGQLAAGVAHEINNPIGFVRSNLGTLRDYLDAIFQLLAQYEQLESSVAGESGNVVALRAFKKRIDLDYLRTDIGELLAETADGITRVVRIVGDLKDFSHVDRAEWQMADLHEGLDSTLNVVAHELKYRADVVKQYGRLPRIHCLPFQLNQVFMNLLVNAAHALDRRGTITIRTGCEDDHVWVSVSDTGCGIEPQHLGRIFEPFFTTKPVGKGTGLGLSVSYNIVQKHGGTIAVESAVGVGTTFMIRLPRDANQAVA
jgi:signal transduction histidine kinase/ligand-binding sensor domain-containing protein